MRVETTFARRLGSYLGEMLPLPPHVGLAVLLWTGIAALAGRIHGVAVSPLSWTGLVGTASLFALMVLLRLMDELKDEDIDRKLFPDRPLPSGRVRREDLRRALGGVSALYLAINAGLGWAFGAAAVVLGWAWLMYRRFFAPDALRRSLWLTLATHNPVVPLMIAYGFAVFAAGHGLSPGDVRWRAALPAVGMLWSPFLAWELARKIRCAEEEDDYVTYSRLLGRRGAVLAVWGVQAVGVGLAFGLWAVLDLHWLGAATVLAAFGLNLAAGIRFLLRPGPRTSRLRPFATAYVAASLVGAIVGVAASR